MFGQHAAEELYRRKVERQVTQSDLHNVVYSEKPEEWSPEDSDRVSEEGGTWGERDVGGPVNTRSALSEYEALRREMTNLSLQRTKSRDTAATRPRASLFRSRTSMTRPRTVSRARIPSDLAAEITKESEAGPDADDKSENDFELDGFLRDGRFEKRTPEGDSAKKVGVVWKHLTVKGVGATAVFTKTLPDAVIGTFGPDLYRLVTRFVPALHFGQRPPTRDLIHDFSGTVRPGEMMLVLGRPGSGCSTFLKVIANERKTYAAVEGEVTYGGISAEEQKKHYKGEVNYSEFPTNPETVQQESCAVAGKAREEYGFI